MNLNQHSRPPYLVPGSLSKWGLLVFLEPLGADVHKSTNAHDFVFSEQPRGHGIALKGRDVSFGTHTFCWFFGSTIYVAAVNFLPKFWLQAITTPRNSSKISLPVFINCELVFCLSGSQSLVYLNRILNFSNSRHNSR